jgi:hypothetical protein
VTFNPFEVAPTASLTVSDTVALRRNADTHAALGHPAGRAWLKHVVEAERRRPSYVPGNDLGEAAYYEGRKAMLADIERWLDGHGTEGA